MTESLRIGIVAQTTFYLPPPTHTGDVVILDLARSLDELGHDVDLYAPQGTLKPGRGRVIPIPASWGKGTPFSWELEQIGYDSNEDDLLREDVVHDFSATKRFAENLYNVEHHDGVVSTLLGGVWTHPDPPVNIVVWSEAMRRRGLRGATDYEDTPTPEMGGPSQRPIKDAHVVLGGVDTDWYSPGDTPKEDFFLWMNRWHPAKGYQVAIELARKTGIPLVMAGEHPDNEMFDYQRNCALEAQRLAADLPNVRFEWLPADPHHHEAKRELYRRAKALLYSIQFQEPFGLGQVEALACGTPVIGIDYGSVPEVVQGGLTGLVCQDDMADLSIACEAIEGIDPANCRREAVRRFDRRVMARAYLEQYELVMEGKIWGN